MSFEMKAEVFRVDGEFVMFSNAAIVVPRQFSLTYVVLWVGKQARFVPAEGEAEEFGSDPGHHSGYPQEGCR